MRTYKKAEIGSGFITCQYCEATTSITADAQKRVIRAGKSCTVIRCRKCGRTIGIKG